MERTRIDKRFKVLPCQAEMMVYWRKKGESYRKIAERFHVHWTRVYYTINQKKNDEFKARRRKRKPWKRWDHEKIRENQKKNYNRLRDIKLRQKQKKKDLPSFGPL